ncbi:hypothetical protein CEXT_217801 [Caerostris extrusa]|uniref:Uncharacterized protein n=1 Tax=Caerostris extrusa TaxID=172846 RepID=A0AAV4RF75_CAEEX|nr:hypothetical protein CEXT_217801 [Caerostris extrusa]
MSPFSSSFCVLFIYFLSILILCTQTAEIKLKFDPIPISEDNRNPLLDLDNFGNITIIQPNQQNRNRGKKNKKKGYKNINTPVLMDLMGKDFQPPWMTYKNPKKPLISVPAQEVLNLEEFSNRWAHRELVDSLKQQNIAAELEKWHPNCYLT